MTDFGPKIEKWLILRKYNEILPKDILTSSGGKIFAIVYEIDVAFSRQ